MIPEMVMPPEELVGAALSSEPADYKVVYTIGIIALASLSCMVVILTAVVVILLGLTHSLSRRIKKAEAARALLDATPDAMAKQQVTMSP